MFRWPSFAKSKQTKRSAAIEIPAFISLLFSLLVDIIILTECNNNNDNNGSKQYTCKRMIFQHDRMLYFQWLFAYYTSKTNANTSTRHNMCSLLNIDCPESVYILAFSTFQLHTN